MRDEGVGVGDRDPFLWQPLTDLEVDEIIPEDSAYEGVGITKAQAAHNYKMAGTKVESDSSEIIWNRFEHLHNPDVENLIKEVMSETKHSGKLTEFQEIFLHSIGSKKDTFVVIKTGAGKTEATGFAGLILRKVYKEPTVGV